MNDHAKKLAEEWASLGPVVAMSKLDLKTHKSGRNILICCPFHNERTPSCSVGIGSQGTLRIHCFACSQTWDIHALVGQLFGIEPRTSFPALLEHEADLLGRWDIADELRGKAEPRPAPVRAPRPAPEPERERVYPPASDVDRVLTFCTMVEKDEEVSAWLRSRKLDPSEVDVRGLAYALPKSAPTPPWARFAGKTWIETGHRLIVPLVDHLGAVRSIRAGRVVDGDTPKRLPPAGHKISGLVMADAMATDVLKAGLWPEDSPWRPQFMIAEGEPDWLTIATMLELSRGPQCAMIGIYSGAWTADFARRIPKRSSVIVTTDQDAAGDKYAKLIAESLVGRQCDIQRAKVVE